MKNLIIAAVTATVISAAIPQAEARSSLNKAKSERSGNTRVTVVGGSRIHSVNRGLPRVIQHGTSNAGYKWGKATRIQQNCKRGGPNPRMAACK